MFKKIFLLAIVFTFPLCAFSRQPQLTPEIVTSKMKEIMKAHATYKTLNPILVKRTLVNYIEELDPTKSYFIEPDIKPWLEPSDALVEQILRDYSKNNFTVFNDIHAAMVKAIQRRHELETQIQTSELPKHVNPEEFKDMKWTKNEQELLDRLIRIKGLQLESAAKLNPEMKDKSLQRIAKRQAKFEEDVLTTDPTQKERFILSDVLKAMTAALDAHTAYFTPDEAAQFMINVQQRLFGIGAQLRDDINGFTVIKIIEGGPAANSKELKLKDRIIAVNGEPVVGMDIIDAVDLIRGEENTPVTLTIIREVGEGDAKTEEKHDIVIKRGEVVLKETRYETSYEPFGDGIIAVLKLHSFYQDPESSSTQDLENEINKLRKDHKIRGIILDLRYNSGGMLSQAVGIAGLFITKGVVVSIKDDTGSVQHLRETDSKMTWDGPLIVLVNRSSASASEIVAGTLQDYGRGLIVGDDHTYGKGTFQTFTLNDPKKTSVNPTGEYKVTRGKYYTVSGNTPQLTGVFSDIIVPGALTEMDVGEKFSKFPLENDKINPSFDDDLGDIPYSQRDKLKILYKFDLQQKLHTYEPYSDSLKKNSAYRIEHNKNYQNFLKEIKKKDKTEDEPEDEFGQNDLQLTEALNIMKDLILLQQ